MNQPAAVDPDLPPTSPPTSSPPSAGHTHGVYASTSLGAHEAGAAPTSRPQHSQRPQLTLQLTPPPVEGPTGRPISPTAPSPAETGTLVRRKSSAKTKLPSEHPLPAPPPLPSPSAIHFPSPFGFGSPHEQRAGHATGAGASGAAPGAAGPSGSTSPTSPTSPSAYLDIPLAGGPPSSGSSSSSSSELFWLPASLHPELAPQEFKAFIREQTTPEALARRSSLRSTGGPGAQGSTSPGPGAGPGGGRAGSLGAGGQQRPVRRASLLRGEYKPRQDDGVGEENDERGGGGARPRLGSRTGRRSSGDLKRTASDGSRGAGRRGSVVSFEELTIKDLQRLEELAGESSRDPLRHPLIEDTDASVAFLQLKLKQKGLPPARKKRASDSVASCDAASVSTRTASPQQRPRRPRPRAERAPSRRSVRSRRRPKPARVSQTRPR